MGRESEKVKKEVVPVEEKPIWLSDDNIGVFQNSKFNKIMSFYVINTLDTRKSARGRRIEDYHFEDGELDSFLKKSLKYWKSSGNGQLVMKNLKESELDIFPPLADYTERVCFSYTKQCELICFFGHIRNSLAHGRFNVVGTKKDPIIIMEDKNSSGNCSARMILHLSTMNKWITLFESRFGIDCC